MEWLKLYGYMRIQCSTLQDHFSASCRLPNCSRAEHILLPCNDTYPRKINVNNKMQRPFTK